MTWQTAWRTLLIALAVYHGVRGFWTEVIKGDRPGSVYHVAWLGVFMAIIAGNQ